MVQNSCLKYFCHLLLKIFSSLTSTDLFQKCKASNFCSFCQGPPANGRALLSLTYSRHFTNWILKGVLVSKAPALLGFPHGRISALVCMWGNLLYRHLFPSRWVRTARNHGEKQWWNHWHHFVSQKDMGLWGGSWRAFRGGGDVQQHAHLLFIPRDWLHGTESGGKAGPMQSVSQDFMVRADNVW